MVVFVMNNAPSMNLSIITIITFQEFIITVVFSSSLIDLREECKIFLDNGLCAVRELSYGLIA